MVKSLRDNIIKLLRWSERYTKTDMVYLAESGFWLMSAQVYGSIISLILSILFAHFVSKEIYGVYRYILSIAGIAAAFTLSGMNTAITQAVAKGREGIFKASLPIQLRWAIFSSLFLLSASAYYFFQSNIIYGVCFLLIAIIYPLSSVANTFNSFLQGKKDFRMSGLSSIASSTIQFIGLAGAILASTPVVFLVLAYYITTTATSVYFCIWTLKTCKPNDNVDASDISFGKHLSFTNVFSIISAQVDAVLIYFILGPASLAVYSFAILIPDRLRIFFSFLPAAALPKIAQKGEKASRLVLQKILPLSITTATLIIVYALVAPFIFSLFYPQYLESVMYTQVYALSLIGIIASFAITGLFADRNRKALSVLNIGGPMIKIVLVCIFVYSLGLWGAIIARILSQVIQTLIPFVFIRSTSSSINQNGHYFRT